jgi:hypothetical protein
VASGSFTVANTIVQAGRCLGPIDDGGFNLQFRSFGCPGRQANPELEQLANNGGPTQTIAVEATSPAIDQGPAFPLVCPATDQRGDPRPDNSESACDIGAFELQDSRALPSGVVSGASAGPRSFALRVHGTETEGMTITTVQTSLPVRAPFRSRRNGRRARRALLRGYPAWPGPAASSASACSGLKNTRSATTAQTVSSGRSTMSWVPSSLCSTGTIA